MLDRFKPWDLFRGHFKALSDYSGDKPIRDRTTLLVMLAVPVFMGALTFFTHTRFLAPGSVLAGVALLAGGFLSAFTHLSTLRLKLTEREKEWGEVERPDRDAIDETAAHLLTAAYLSGVTAFVLVFGMNVAADHQGAVGGLWASAISVLGTYVFLLFLLALPRLYSAYAAINNVRDELSGTHTS